MKLAKHAWLIFGATIITLGLALPNYWVYLVSAAGIGALIARGIGLVTRSAGIILLCQMSFAAIGGWVVSWLSLHVPAIPYPVLVLAGGLAALPVGMLLGVLTLRIRGVELAVVMLGFAAALDLLLLRDGFPGTSTGTPVVPDGPLTNAFWFLVFTWGTFFLIHALYRAVNRSALGLGWNALRTSERAAAALGVRRGLAKATALGFGALAAGLAGGLLAGQYGLLSSEVFTPLTSLVNLAIAVMMGASVMSGAMLAGTLSVLMPEVLRRLGLPLDLGNALFALGAVDVLRRGHGGVAEQLTAAIESKYFSRVRTECVPATPSTSTRSTPPPATHHSHPICEITHLTVAFGAVQALNDVSLALHEGEVHALVGPNGAGKSTLIDAVTGFVATTAGTIMLEGAPIDTLDARQRATVGIRRTFQQSRIIDTVTVDEYLRGAAGSRSRALTEHHEELRTTFGLPRGDVPIRLMDIGSRRILEVAAALAARPRVLLLDEPAAGLDDQTASLMAQHIRTIPARFGATVLLVEHDMSFIRTASHRVTVLNEGTTLHSGDVSEVLSDSRVVDAYLGTGATP